ncbi:MAG: hypothetical protein ACKVWV_16920 [Planctomycetota bacterium]
MAKNNSVQASISTLLESFAEQVEALVRQSAFDQVSSALAGLGGAPSATRGGGLRRKAGRPAGSKNKVRGGKRTSEGLDEMSARLLAHVKSNPGQRGEQIAKAMRSDAKTIRLPMKKLIAAKKVKTKGQRRGMTYAPA